MSVLERLRRGELAGATRLDLSQELTEFPSEIYDLADTLEVLNLSGNRLSTLPAELPRLKKLKVVFCSNNPFETLPEVLGECPDLAMVGFKSCQLTHVPAQALSASLRWLILTDNRLERLPDVFERCPALQKLMLAGNQLRQLPPSLGQCHGLELVRIASNRLDTMPSWLLQLPRLAWLAYAGNPFCADHDVGPGAAIEWSSLRLQQKLGEGASGIVYQAQLPSGETVAVKCFKGAQTSDGSPEDEIAAALLAGRHPNLVPIQGRLVGHPTAMAGLVMDLVAPTYQILAGPPSLNSCTRDEYPDSTVFETDQAQALVAGVASAAAHLHRHGVMHGDLYGHNILWRGDGQALLGDFGAASRYQLDSSANARALEAIEVRAFGILLEEFRSRCEAAPVHWEALGQACRQPTLAARPRFAEIEGLL